MSQLSESGGVQTNVTINGLPSSLGGSAHQPQLSEAQISAEKFSTGERLNYYQPLSMLNKEVIGKVLRVSSTMIQMH
ncbi:hypothetical protein ACOSP7_020137 [Xanthoceras sorbifolium]